MALTSAASIIGTYLQITGVIGMSIFVLMALPGVFYALYLTRNSIIMVETIQSDTKTFFAMYAIAVLASLYLIVLAFQYGVWGSMIFSGVAYLIIAAYQYIIRDRIARDLAHCVY